MLTFEVGTEGLLVANAFLWTEKAVFDLDAAELAYSTIIELIKARQRGSLIRNDIISIKWFKF